MKSAPPSAKMAAPPPMPPNPPFLLFSMPLWQTFYSHYLWLMLGGLVILTLIADTIQRVALRNARGDRCKTSFVNRFVAELMLFGVRTIQPNQASIPRCSCDALWPSIHGHHHAASPDPNAFTLPLFLTIPFHSQMAAVTIMTIYEASARELLTEHVDQLHWVDVYVSVSAILLIWVGAWVWCFTVKKREYYQNLMTTSNVGRQSLDLQARSHGNLCM